MKIGLIAYGFVNKATHNNIDKCHEVVIYDKYIERYKNNFKSILNTDAVFIAVPTPTRDGIQDINAIEENLYKLNKNKYKGLVIIKSTILPNNIKFFIRHFNNLNILTCPEFLNQANPFDYEGVEVIGCSNIDDFNLYKSIFDGDNQSLNSEKKVWPISKINKRYKMTDPVTAMVVKYVHNCFGALKVTYFNEMYDVCNQLNVNYRTMIDMLLTVNDNVGKQYTTIAADGKRGFAGACFPKDVVAFSTDYNSSETLKGTIASNKIYRYSEMKEVL
jgi:UDPglucose 6-dehydrogenase